MMAQNTTASPLAIFERRYQNDHQCEHGILLDSDGRVIVIRRGDQDSVSFQPNELARASLLSHSHPRDLPPSGADLAIAAEYGLTLRAFGTAPDTGQQFNHIVSVERPSEKLARQIERIFDDEVEQAEKELARQPFGDLQWQRESRHLAVRRIADRLGFTYQRIEYKDYPLRETTRHEQKRLSILANVKPTMRDQFFTSFHANLVRALVRQADSTGRIPPQSLDTVRQIVTNQTQRAFLGSPLRDGTLAPFTVERGEVVPRSAFFRTLWHLMRGAALVAIERHANIMRKHLPADLLHAYEFATISPFDVPVSEAEGPQFDPLHLWAGPDGKRLSDRIWTVAGDMRRKLDDYLTLAIAQRKDVQTMARELEPFLLPGKGGYEAMRLARTETAAAYARADAVSAQMNPFVQQYTPMTAPKHACCDNCDIEEANGPYDKSDFLHLPPFHPNCICTVVWHIVEDIKAVVERLRQIIEQAISQARKSLVDFIGPLSRRFLDILFRGKA